MLRNCKCCTKNETVSLKEFVLMAACFSCVKFSGSFVGQGKC